MALAGWLRRFCSETTIKILAAVLNKLTTGKTLFDMAFAIFTSPFVALSTAIESIFVAIWVTGVTRT